MGVAEPESTRSVEQGQITDQAFYGCDKHTYHNNVSSSTALARAGVRDVGFRAAIRTFLSAAKPRHS
jgi:hypothetical protein